MSAPTFVFPQFPDKELLIKPGNFVRLIGTLNAKTWVLTRKGLSRGSTFV